MAIEIFSEFDFRLTPASRSFLGSEWWPLRCFQFRLSFDNNPHPSPRLKHTLLMVRSPTTSINEILVSLSNFVPVHPHMTLVREVIPVSHQFLIT